MKSVTRQMVVVALLLATVVGLFVAAQLGQRRLEDASARIALNARRQQALADVWQLLRQAESSQRGYILVGTSQYLAPFRQASMDFDAALARLDVAYAGAGAATRSDVAQLRQLSNAEFDEMRQTVEAFGMRGRAAALQIIRTDVGASTMSQIDDLVRKIEGLDNAEAVEASRRWQAGRWGSVATTSAALGGEHRAAAAAERPLAAPPALQGARDRGTTERGGELEMLVKQRTEDFGALDTPAVGGRARTCRTVARTAR